MRIAVFGMRFALHPGNVYRILHGSHPFGYKVSESVDACLIYELKRESAVEIVYSM